MNQTTYTQTTFSQGEPQYHPDAIHITGHAGMHYFQCNDTRYDPSLVADGDSAYHPRQSTFSYCYSDEQSRQIVWDLAAVRIAGVVAYINACHPSDLCLLQQHALKPDEGRYPRQSEVYEVQHDLRMAEASQVALQAGVLVVLRDTRMWAAVLEAARMLSQRGGLSRDEVGAIFRSGQAPTRNGFLRSGQECPLNVPQREGFACDSLLQSYRKALQRDRKARRYAQMWK